MSNTFEMPIGTIAPTVLGASSMPKNWLLCDGSQIPPQYQELSILLGSQATPNLIGRVLIGAGQLSRATVNQTDGRKPMFDALGKDINIGDTGGECAHQLTIPELAKHWHPINGGDFGIHYQSFKGDKDDDRPFETNVNPPLQGTDNVGGDVAHYNVQPYYAINYMIYGGDV